MAWPGMAWWGAAWRGMAWCGGGCCLERGVCDGVIVLCVGMGVVELVVEQGV